MDDEDAGPLDYGIEAMMAMLDDDDGQPQPRVFSREPLDMDEAVREEETPVKASKHIAVLEAKMLELQQELERMKRGGQASAPSSAPALATPPQKKAKLQEGAQAPKGDSENTNDLLAALLNDEDDGHERHRKPALPERKMVKVISNTGGDNTEKKPAVARGSASFSARPATSSSLSSLASLSSLSASSSSSASRPSISGVAKDPQSFEKEAYSGLRIKNRKVSSQDMSNRMEGRKFVKLGAVLSEVRKAGEEIEGDWVTIGIVVEKGSTKQSANGKNFAAWTLSDFKDSSQLLLFDTCHKQHWKLMEGTIIAILNPSVLKPKADAPSSANNTLRMSLDNPQKLMILGESMDLGICKGTRRDGANCTMPVDTSKGNYCEYHVSTEYKKAMAKRGNMQGSGVDPKKAAAKAPQMGVVPKQKEPTTKLGKIKEEVMARMAPDHIFRRSVASMSLAGTLPKNLEHLVDTPKKSDNPYKQPERKLGSFLSKNAPTNVQPKEPIVADSTTDRLLQLNPQEMAKPSMGRGLHARGSVEFVLEPAVSAKSAKVKQASMAWSKIQKQEEAAKRDPSAETKEDIGRFIKEANSQASEKVSSSSSNKAEKKPKLDPMLQLLAGKDMDLSSDDWKKVQGVRSKLKDQIEEENEERISAKLADSEHIEKMQEKMKEVKEKLVTCMLCTVCKRLTFGKPPRCVELRHRLEPTKTTQRWFSCSGCGNHTSVLGEKIQTSSCDRCGKSSWVRASMFKESTKDAGQKKVLARGIEHGRFLGSSIDLNSLV